MRASPFRIADANRLHLQFNCIILPASERGKQLRSMAFAVAPYVCVLRRLDRLLRGVVADWGVRQAGQRLLHQQCYAWGKDVRSLRRPVGQPA